MKKSPLIIIFFIVFIDLIGFGIVLPLLPFYAKNYGATPFLVGLLFVAYSLMQFIFTPLLGRLSDRYGRRPILLVSLFGSTLSYLLFGIGGSLPLLFISRALAGAMGGNISTAQAYIADVTTDENRARGMGLIGAAFGLGFVFGPAMGGILSQWGAQVPFFAAAIICGTNLLFAFKRLPESLPTEKRIRVAADGTTPPRRRYRDFWKVLLHPHVGGLIFLFFLTMVSFTVMEATLALLAEKKFQFTAVHTGYFFAYIGILIVIMQGVLVGPLVKLWGEKRLISLGCALLVIGLIMTPFSPSVLVLSIAMIFLAFGQGMLNPSLHSLVSKNCGAHEKGEVLGMQQAFGCLARIGGPFMGGLLFTVWGHTMPYYFAALLMIFAFFSTFWILEKFAPLAAKG